jgi:hypothetical protein
MNGTELHRLPAQAQHKELRTTAGYIEDVDRVDNTHSGTSVCRSA